MQSFVLIFVSLCFDGFFVIGDMALASSDGEKQHSSAILMMYKFMDDIFAMKNKISDLQNTVENQQECLKECKNQMSELQNTEGDDQQIDSDAQLLKELQSTIDNQQDELDELQNTHHNEQNGLENKINKLKDSVDELKDRVDDQQEEISQLKYVNGQLESQINEWGPNIGSGATYVRWGKTDCPSTTGAVKIYEGYAAGDHYNHAGGAVELLCLPRKPTWGKYSDAHITHAYVYGVEIELAADDSDRLFGKMVHDENVPCVVCQAVGRYAVLRIPGRTDCVAGWTMEYTGYLFAGHHKHAKSTDYTCLDSDPEYVEGKTGNQNGRLLYPVEANCGADYGLQCPPYQDGRELACVVCTK